jgi:hypothetical protein
MLPVILKIAPGVDSQSTPMQVGQGMIDSNLIRHRNGRIQKLAGCTRLISTTFSGVATHILPWAALNGTEYVGIGTTVQLALIASSSLVDITPAAGVGSGEWAMDKWGQNLVAAPKGGTVYQWVPPVSGGNIAVALAGAPSIVNGIVVATPQQQIIAWGAYSVSLAAQDPLLIRWCDVADNTVWTATATNQAGSFRLSSGSEVKQVLWFGVSGLIWTDLDFWIMTYAGFPLIYGFNRIAPNCGAISSRAADALGTRVAWMSQNDFFVFQGGQVQVLPCSVHDFVFDNLDRSHTAAVHTDTNSFAGEIMWRFPTTGSAGVCDAYVKWNVNENVWDKGEGSPTISAWADQSVVGPPIGADYTGLVQQFETSNDFDGTVLTSFFETGWFRIAEGEQSVYIDRILPDFVLNTGGSVQVTITVADEIPPDDTDYPVRTYGPYTVSRSTPYLIVRASGRVAKLKVECSAADTFWRYGEPPAQVSVDGRR